MTIKKIIVLINPYIDFSQIGHTNRSYPPLSLLYISSLLKAKSISMIQDIKLIDANHDKIKEESKFLEKLSADIFVINIAPLDRWQCPPIEFSYMGFVKKLKANNPKSNFIFISPYDKEKVFPTNLKQINTKNDFWINKNPETRAFNIISKLTGSKRLIDEKKGIKNLIAPDLEITKDKKYSFPLYEGNFFEIETSRGCPHSCKFCNKLMYPRYEQKTITQIREELEALHKSNIKNLIFIDLDFLADKKFAEDICKLLLEFKPNFNYIIQARASGIYKRIARLLKESGCKLIQIGVETFSEKLLKQINKKQDLATIKKAFAICKKFKIPTMAFMITGIPGQTKAQLVKDLKKLKDIKTNYVSFVPYIDYNNMQVKGIKQARIMNLKFYLSLGWMIKRILMIRSFNDISILLKNFIKILKQSD